MARVVGDASVAVKRCIEGGDPGSVRAQGYALERAGGDSCAQALFEVLAKVYRTLRWGRLKVAANSTLNLKDRAATDGKRLAKRVAKVAAETLIMIYDAAHLALIPDTALYIADKGIVEVSGREVYRARGAHL